MTKEIAQQIAVAITNYATEWGEMPDIDELIDIILSCYSQFDELR